MAASPDSDLPDFADLEAYNALAESSDEDESAEESSGYDSSIMEDAEGDDAPDGDYKLEDAPMSAQPGADQQPADPAAQSPEEEDYHGFPPPGHLPVAFKRRSRAGRPRLTPHERARREEARLLKRAEERSKRVIRRHETSYTKAHKAEILLYLLTQRVELKEWERAMRMREGISLGAPERMPGVGEELVRYRPVNFDDAAKKYKLPCSTVQNWWRKREKILGKDCPELHRKRTYFEVVPIRDSARERPVQIVVENIGPPPPPGPRERSNVVHLGLPPGVMAYLWELGVGTT